MFTTTPKNQKYYHHLINSVCPIISDRCDEDFVYDTYCFIEFDQSFLITLTPYIVLPLFATRFADYAGGIWVSFIQPHLF